MSHEIKAITIKNPNKRVPVILNKRIILKKQLLPFKGKTLQVVKPLQTQEDILYESRPGDFLSGEVGEAVIINTLNKLTDSCRTVAKCKSHSGQVYEKTSDEITKIIGQKYYDTLFTALCSVINQELKIRGIFSLLTVPKTTKPVACQVKDENTDTKFNAQNKELKMKHELVEEYCQTEESFIAAYKAIKMRRRAKRSQPAPYVIREIAVQKKPKKIVVPPSSFNTLLDSPAKIKQEEFQKEVSTFPDLGTVFDEDSNSSLGRLSAISIATSPELMNNPISMIMANVDKVTEHQKDTRSFHDFDTGKVMQVRDKQAPLSKQLLQKLPQQQRIRMLIQQGMFDFHNCLQQDENEHLPIHVAVMTNDLDLLKRQCLVLKMRGVSVDIAADNLTPLKMALYQDNTAMTSLLLQYNADILDSDAQDLTYFHIAAERATEHLHVLINHCRLNARKILEEADDLWKNGYESKSDEELSKILLTHVNKITNDQGYTPLMLAAKLGLYENVKLLVESAPQTVNTWMPTSGHTALYIAVGAACMDCCKRGNKSKVVDHFRKTIEILVEYGADPNSKNFDGANVNDLLTDYNIADLSMLIANKMTCRNLGEGNVPANKINSIMLIKDSQGKVDVKVIEKSQKKTKAGRITKSQKKSPANFKGTCLPPSSSPNKPIIIKTETITSDVIKSQDVAKNIGVLNNMSKVQNFQLNKPLILKSVKNKRQLEIAYKSIDKSNTND